jgi:hypothetical protein
MHEFNVILMRNSDYYRHIINSLIFTRKKVKF